MFPTLHSLKCVTRAALLITVSASLVATVQPATAQPTSINPAAAPTIPSYQPVPTSEEVLNRLGIQRPEATDMTELSQQIAQQVRASGVLPGTRSPQQPEAGGLPENLSPISALSAAIATTLNSSANSNYRDVLLMADADGSEDLVADHGVKVGDLSISKLPTGWTLTRVASSGHTFANGYTSTVGYYGDSVGNVYIVAQIGTNIDDSTATVLNLPGLLNAFGSLNSDDQIVITGLAVNPVADLSSFANVNGSYSFFNGKIGEILYVSFWDTGGGLRLAANNQLVRSGVLAFPIADDVSPAMAPPAIQSDQDFPVTVGGAFGVAFSIFSNFAGLTVDDDGSVYFQQVDLINFTGGNIVKITSVDRPGTGGNQDRSLATNGILTLTTLNPAGGVYGTTSGPLGQANRFTNYSGTSPAFGNIVSLAAAPTNILYAALARSFVPTDTAETQATEGLFANPVALGATPSMIVSFADTAGAYDSCSAPLATVTGTLPIADGFADAAQAGLTLLPGVNNFRAFVLGNGPDARGALVGATVSNTLQMDFQVDYTLYSGLAVDEEAKVYVISGGTPAGIGLDPSPRLGEILVFPDQRSLDRRADYIDLRGDELPNPPLSGGNIGNGVSNRYDHIYYQAPIDQLTLTPVGLSGLARGFLVYLNRTRAWVVGSDLPNGHPQGNDEHSGPLFFFLFDILGQIAGGDDGISRLSSTIADASGPLAPATPSLGGFEFIYREYVTTTGTLTPTAWNMFYLNSNGSITFGAGDDTSTPTVAGFLSGLPKVAGAWADLNPGSRWQEAYTNTFPVQALGFAGINHFVVRWINVPSTGSEACDSSNSFTISLYDDGTGNNESILPIVNLASQKATDVNPFLTEGPTDLRYVASTNGTLYGFSPRADRSGNLCVTYGRMDLTGVPTTGTQVLVGATPGYQAIPTWPALNLSQAALLNDQPFPRPLGLPMGPLTPATPYEFFNLGVPASYTVTGGITVTFPATPTFDLRQEGNDTVLSTPLNQPDLNRGQVCYYISYFRGLFPLVFRQN